MKTIKRNLIAGSVALLAPLSSVSAASIEEVPCLVIEGLWDALTAIGPALIMLMFIYGAAKYVYSANDPGGRKQGRSICIHAIIGALIFGTILAVVAIMRSTGAFPLCTGIKI